MTILVGSQFRGLALLNLDKKWLKPHGLLMCHDSVWKFSFLICCVIQHPAVIPHLWLLPQSTSTFLLWHPHLNWALKRCYVWSRATCLQNFWSWWGLWVFSKEHSSYDLWFSMFVSTYVYQTNEPALPLLVTFASSWHSINSVFKLILDTDVNSTNQAPFPHYIDYPPLWSASIPIPCWFIAHGFFSPNIPGCFGSEDKRTYSKGDIVVLGMDGPQEAVVEGFKEVGRHFISYEIWKVGMIPDGCLFTTQLVIPLSCSNPQPLPLIIFRV